MRLVGTDKQRIVDEVTHLLHDEEAYQAMSRAHNPYGDGLACGRILHALKHTGYRYEFYYHLCHWSWLHWLAYCGSICLVKNRL